MQQEVKRRDAMCFAFEKFDGKSKLEMSFNIVIEYEFKVKKKTTFFVKTQIYRK